MKNYKKILEGMPHRLVKLKNGRSGRRFARDVGIHQQNMALYLTGQAVPSLLTAIRIAEATHCSLDWLCMGKTEAFYSAH